MNRRFSRYIFLVVSLCVCSLPCPRVHVPYFPFSLGMVHKVHKICLRYVVKLIRHTPNMQYAYSEFHSHAITPRKSCHVTPSAQKFPAMANLHQQSFEQSPLARETPDRFNKVLARCAVACEDRSTRTSTGHIACIAISQKLIEG